MFFSFALFAQQSASLQGLILPIILFGAAIYFLMIRPAQQQKKKAEDLRNSIKVGDEVITIGAWKGTVIEVDNEGYRLQLDEQSTAYILRAGIARKVVNEDDLVDEDWDDDEDAAEDTDTPTKDPVVATEDEDALMDSDDNSAQADQPDPDSKND